MPKNKVFGQAVGGVPKCRALNSDKWKVTRHKKIEKDS